MGKREILEKLAEITAAVEALPDDPEPLPLDTAENARRNIEKHGIPTGTDDPLLLAAGAAPLAPVWRTLTFGDLRAGDVVKLDEDGPVETVNVSEDDDGEWWLATSQRCGHYYEGDPVLVRHPRPEVGDGRDVPVATTNPERTLLAALLAIDAEHVKAHDVPGCALCWPGDGSWPCTTRMETDAALDALRELDACRRALGDS